MDTVIREAPLGFLIRYFTNKKYLQYPEEKSGFELPQAWIDMMNHLESSQNQAKFFEEGRKFAEGSNSNPRQPEESAKAEETNSSDHSEVFGHSPASQRDLEAENQEIEEHKSISLIPKKTKDGFILVDWYCSDDAENPHNWSNRKRALVSTIICLYTFVVYTSSAIYTASETGIMQEFGVSDIVVTLGLSLYVLGYGTGPLIFSPMSEIPVIGRNPVYIITMFLFVIISIPTALVGNFAGLMILRFLQGFFGSPCLASGGASIGDMYSFNSLPYAMMAWVAAAYCGPALGPLLSGFAVPIKGWRWSLYESIWASAPVLILMFLFLPETSTPTILLRRAQRLRKIFHDKRFRSQSELDQHNMTVRHITVEALIKPMEITIKDPAVLFVQIYTAIIYGIYYSFFEVFPLVYPVYYNMNLGEVGLVFLCVLVSCMIAVLGYWAYIFYWMNPRIARLGWPIQEYRLIPALPASFGPTVGLFLFAWTAKRSIHWIVPTIGITIYGATVFVVMQCLFVYIPLSYPKYAASLFAANDFFRSALACGSTIFAHPLFGNLGVARGVSLLGGLSVIGVFGIWALYYFGAQLRSMSRFAIYQAE